LTRESGMQDTIERTARLRRISEGGVIGQTADDDNVPYLVPIGPNK